MKLFVWSENLKTEAYHGDGSAVVCADTLIEARAILAQRAVLLEIENQKLKDEGVFVIPESYQWDRAVMNAEPTDILEIKKGVVILTVGCDC